MGTSKKESEKVIEQKLVALCKLNGGMCIKLLSFHILGLPDRMCLFPKAKIVFVELKTSGEKPRKIQLFMIDKIRALGFRVEIIDSTEKVVDLINDIILC